MLAALTIVDLRAERVYDARVWCLNRACQHYGVVPFEAIGAPAGFTFIDLLSLPACAAASHRIAPGKSFTGSPI